MNDLRIGCSGYHYEEWKNIFYPSDLSSKKWFEFYCQHFNTLELNSTFYRFPRIESLESWYDRSPSDFIFTVKAPRLITHFKKFNDAQRLLSDFYSNLTVGLREKLGPVLFQFPAQFTYTEQRLEQILGLINDDYTNVVEFRDVSWWKEDIYNALSEKNVTFCGMSHPKLPEDVVHNTSTVYYRLHGVPHLYTSRYEIPQLENLLSIVEDRNRNQKGYIYFNNTADGAAIQNAKELIDLSAQPVHVQKHQRK